MVAKGTSWAGTIQYVSYGSKLVVLYYVGDCVYLYISKELGKWFLDTLRNRFHVIFLGCAPFLYLL